MKCEFCEETIGELDFCNTFYCGENKRVDEKDPVALKKWKELQE